MNTKDFFRKHKGFLSGVLAGAVIVSAGTAVSVFAEPDSTELKSNGAIKWDRDGDGTDDIYIDSADLTRLKNMIDKNEKDIKSIRTYIGINSGSKEDGKVDNGDGTETERKTDYPDGKDGNTTVVTETTRDDKGSMIGSKVTTTTKDPNQTIVEVKDKDGRDTQRVTETIEKDNTVTRIVEVYTYKDDGEVDEYSVAKETYSITTDGKTSVKVETGTFNDGPKTKEVKNAEGNTVKTAKPVSEYEASDITWAEKTGGNGSTDTEIKKDEPEAGQTTYIIYNTDGTKTIIIKDDTGKIISAETVDPTLTDKIASLQRRTSKLNVRADYTPAKDGNAAIVTFTPVE